VAMEEVAVAMEVVEVISKSSLLRATFYETTTLIICPLPYFFKRFLKSSLFCNESRLCECLNENSFS